MFLGYLIGEKIDAPHTIITLSVVTNSNLTIMEIIEITVQAAKNSLFTIPLALVHNS